MQLTPEEVQTGKDNFNEALAATRGGDSTFEDAVALSRRSFMKGAAGATAGLGSIYFGYDALKGDPVRVGFIGTGDEGNVLLTEHPPAYMDIVAIADLRPTNRQRAFTGDGNARRTGLNKKLGRQKASQIKVYEDHKQLIADPNVEAVVIAVPLSHHAPIAIEAMKAGKHVLTEKLMAHSISQCKEMIEVAAATGRFLAVGHQRHYSVLYDNANFLVKQGLLGDIRHIRAQWHRNNSFPGRDSWRKPISKADAAALDSKISGYDYKSMNELVNWRLYNRTGGGLMAELGSHQMDACSIFLGKVHPLAVQGYGGKNFYGVQNVGSSDKQGDDREIDDHVYVTFEFPGKNYHAKDNPDDVVVVTYSSLNTNRLESFGETLLGSRGTMVVKQEQEALLYKEGSPSTGAGGPEQRLHVIGGKGGPVMDASASLAPSSAAAVASNALGASISRGYTEEMEHFCHCIRNEKPNDNTLRCGGVVAMADAIMALTANLAMKHRKRIVFKDEWFDPASKATPETDPEIVG